MLPGDALAEARDYAPEGMTVKQYHQFLVVVDLVYRRAFAAGEQAEAVRRLMLMDAVQEGDEGA